jgi:WD40 repeat protein
MGRMSLPAMLCLRVGRCDLTQNKGYGTGAFALSPDGKKLVVAGDEDSLFFDVASGKSTTQQRGWGVAAADRVKISPDGMLVAYCSADVRLWSLEKQEFVAVLQSSGKRGTGIPMFSADWRMMVTAWTSGVIRIWELPKLEP